MNVPVPLSSDIAPHLDPLLEPLHETASISAGHMATALSTLLNQTISVSLLKRLRSEQKFPSLDALKTQLLHDKSDTVTFVASLR